VPEVVPQVTQVIVEQEATPIAQEPVAEAPAKVTEAAEGLK